METQEQYTDLATRHNEGKLRWSLVDFKSLEPMVRVLEFGAEKYEIDNWKKGLKTTEVCESLLRHIYSFLDGENNDSESGLPHIGHILVNSMFLSYMMNDKPEMDDRRCEVMRIMKDCTFAESDTNSSMSLSDAISIILDKGGHPKATLVDMGGHHVPNIEKST